MAAYQLQGYSGVQHTLTGEMLRDALAFLQESLRLPEGDSTEDFLVKPRHPAELSVREIREALREHRLQDRAVGLSEKSEFVAVLLDFYRKDCGLILEDR